MQFRTTDEIDLVAVPTAVPCARMFVEVTFRRWHASSAVERALNVVCELVAKAVAASGTLEPRSDWTGHLNLINVRLVRLDHAVGVEVWDSDPFPGDLSATVGDGLKHGCYPLAPGKVVWAQLPVLPRRPLPPLSP